MRVVGRMNSPGAVFMRFGLYCSTASLGGDDLLRADGIFGEMPGTKTGAVYDASAGCGE